MGNSKSLINSFGCNCFEDPDDEASERMDGLWKGHTMMRKVLMGMSNQKLFVRLSEDSSKVSWRVEKGGSWIPSSEEFGEIDLTTITNLKAIGKNGMNFMNNDVVVMELITEDTATRDSWIVGINDLLASWKENQNLKPKQTLTARGTSDKTAYFQKREAEIKERAAERAKAKEKYMKASGGMKYTSQAMANRS